jgi:hypothetical protein
LCYISFWNFADKIKSLIVGGQYGILWHCITLKTVPLFAERAYRNRPDGAAEKAF